MDKKQLHQLLVQREKWNKRALTCLALFAASAAVSMVGIMESGVPSTSTKLGGVGMLVAFACLCLCAYNHYHIFIKLRMAQGLKREEAVRELVQDYFHIFPRKIHY